MKSDKPERISRRGLLRRSASAFLAAAAPIVAIGDETAAKIAKIKDPAIRSGIDAAVNKNLLAAATERIYPGHFTINADGGGFGPDTTWPGLDSWQMAGGYLLLGKTRLV
ncbi:MAG TPA: hypothetical protein VMI31_06455, partial [Fimbriimonadaceae bacterium]|nr:hypothetical protein [Fimbriimonadaceae bacterium]